PEPFELGPPIRDEDSAHVRTLVLQPPDDGGVRVILRGQHPAVLGFPWLIFPRERAAGGNGGHDLTQKGGFARLWITCHRRELATGVVLLPKPFNRSFLDFVCSPYLKPFLLLFLRRRFGLGHGRYPMN